MTDQERLSQLISNARETGVLRISDLNIRELPEFPPGLKELYCTGIPLTSLPTLPEGLRVLHCNNTPLTTLPELPSGLQVLQCSFTLLTALPELPKELKKLECIYTPLIELPDLPDSVNSISASAVLVDNYFCATMNEFITRSNERNSKKRIQERSRCLKEEIMAAAWHPRRVEKWIETGVLDDL